MKRPIFYDHTHLCPICKESRECVFTDEAEKVTCFHCEREAANEYIAKIGNERVTLWGELTDLKVKCKRLKEERDEQERYRIINRKQVDKLERENYLLGGENGRLKNCLASQGEAWEAQLALMQTVVEVLGPYLEDLCGKYGKRNTDGLESLEFQVVIAYDALLAAKQAAGTKPVEMVTCPNHNCTMGLVEASLIEGDLPTWTETCPTCKGKRFVPKETDDG